MLNRHASARCEQLVLAEARAPAARPRNRPAITSRFYAPSQYDLVRHPRGTERELSAEGTMGACNVKLLILALAAIALSGCIVVTERHYHDRPYGYYYR
jgi:hypothetical protein